MNAERNDDEWEEWYQLTPVERWQESMKLRARYLAMGGSLEPEIDLQSPFYSLVEWESFARYADERRQVTVVNHDNV